MSLCDDCYTCDEPLILMNDREGPCYYLCVECFVKQEVKKVRNELMEELRYIRDELRQETEDKITYSQESLKDLIYPERCE